MAAFTLKDIFTNVDILFREAGEYASPIEAYSDTHGRITVEYLVAWADRKAARLALLGNATVSSFTQNTNFDGLTFSGFKGIWSVSSIAGLAPGMTISGGSLPAGTTITAITPGGPNGDIEVSANATATAFSSFHVTGDFRFVSRQNPHQYLSGDPLFCTSVPRVAPEGTPLLLGATPAGFSAGSERIATYTDARLTAIYEYLPWDILEDSQVRGFGGQPDESLLLRNVVAIPTESARQLTYRAGVWVWLETTNPASTPPGKPFPVATEVGVPLPTTDWDYLWVGIPEAAVPKATILAAVGKVNSVPWDDMAPGTFLVKPPAWERTRLPAGGRALNVHVRGCHNPRGWNNFPDPIRENQFFPVGRQTVAGQPVTAQPYGDTDIAMLFRPR